MSDYYFKSNRLGFRKFIPEDLPVFAQMNADEAVMKFFPFPLTKAESDALAQRINEHFDKHQFTYFAVETLQNQAFIGFVGLARQEYETAYSPFVDIGWRLKKTAWGQGFATEGAKACLQYAFETIGLEEIYAVATLANHQSENVMQKIGMKKLEDFDHPKIAVGHPMRRCMMYKISKADYWESEN